MIKFWSISFIIVRFWGAGFDRILRRSLNWGKRSNIVAVMLPDIISGEMRVFKWLVILFGCKIYGIKELEASKSKK